MGVLPDYKDIYELFKKAGNVEAQEQIMALREDDLRRREELLLLRERVNELEARLELANSLRFESPYYWRVTADGKEGPYCQVCKDSTNKMVRLQPAPNSRGWWDCKVCGHYFTDSNYVDRSGNTVIRQGGSWMSA